MAKLSEDSTATTETKHAEVPVDVEPTAAKVPPKPTGFSQVLNFLEGKHCLTGVSNYNNLNLLLCSQPSPSPSHPTFVWFSHSSSSSIALSICPLRFSHSAPIIQHPNGMITPNFNYFLFFLQFSGRWLVEIWILLWPICSSVPHRQKWRNFIAARQFRRTTAQRLVERESTEAATKKLTVHFILLSRWFEVWWNWWATPNRSSIKMRGRCNIEIKSGFVPKRAENVQLHIRRWITFRLWNNACSRWRWSNKYRCIQGSQGWHRFHNWNNFERQRRWIIEIIWTYLQRILFYFSRDSSKLCVNKFKSELVKTNIINSL